MLVLTGGGQGTEQQQTGSKRGLRPQQMRQGIHEGSRTETIEEC